MKLGDDLSSSKMLKLKGWLFLILGVMSSGILLVEVFTWQRLGLFLLAVWSFCRFYYFLFYVLEQYAGRQRRYAGIADAFWYLIVGERDNENANSDVDS